MKVTVLGPNLPSTEHTFHVHKAGCSDIKKMKTYTAVEGDTMDVTDQHELVEIIGGETETEIHEFKFYACVKSLPVGTVVDHADETEINAALDDGDKIRDLGHLAELVKQFAVDHRDDKLREWDIIADHWTISEMIMELDHATTKIRTYGGARRHFDHMVRLPNAKLGQSHGLVCMGGAMAWPNA